MDWKVPAVVVLVLAIVLAAHSALQTPDDESFTSLEPTDPLLPVDSADPGTSVDPSQQSKPIVRPDVFPSDISPDARVPMDAADAISDFEDQIETLSSVLNNKSSSVDEMVEQIYYTAEMLSTLVTDYTFISLYYHLYPNQYADEYEDWSTLAQESKDKIYKTIKSALKGSNSRNVSKAIEKVGLEGDDFHSYGEMTAKEKELLSKENSLIIEYFETDVTVSTLDKVADIYLELVGVRNDLAGLYGYDNYAEYSYELVFGRDYTPGDVSAMYPAMNDAKSIYFALNEALTGNGKMSTSNISWIYGLSYDEKLKMIEPLLEGVSDDMLYLLDYMRDQDLLYIDDVSGQLPGAYTSALSQYDSAIIYIPWSSGRGFNSLVHEFGHASNMCLNPRGSSCYDVMEIHSQGLEALFAAGFTDTVRNGNILGLYSIYSMMIGVFNGLIITEFENWVYEAASDGTLTRNDLYTEFNSIMKSYGIKYSQNNNLFWAGIHHVFDQPCYYISYVTSALSSLEIFSDALVDFDSARTEYLSILYMTDADGYMGAIERAGMRNMMLPENYLPILEYISGWVKLNVK